MSSLNSVLIEGNLTRDPETSTLASGTALCKFSIAYNRNYKKGDIWEKEVSYFDVVVWGNLVDRLADLKKGSSVKVVGRLKQERWNDKEGKAQYKVTIVAEDVKKNAEVQRTSKQTETATREVQEIEDQFEDDIPF